tara:strand:+ start:4401 stop:4586 length:186 start_codon:yes stop_codon:yes gene_type:complete
MKNTIAYVVTRNRRRMEPENYQSADAAHARAFELRQLLKKWNDPDAKRIAVVKTEKPHQIR